MIHLFYTSLADPDYRAVVCGAHLVDEAYSIEEATCPTCLRRALNAQEMAAGRGRQSAAALITRLRTRMAALGIR